jgi:Putative DNA-binding domain
MPFSRHSAGPLTMPSLREVQRAIARSILSHDDIDAMQHLPYDALVSGDRLSVYRDNFAATLVKALRLSYPAVEKLVGHEFFEGAVRTFIDGHPPRTAYLNDYGSNFGDFLEEFPASAQLPYLPDVARLEWAISASLNAVDAPVLDVAALARLTQSDHSRVRFVPHPSLRLLSARYSADAIWRGVLAGDEAALGAIDLTPESVELIVHRGTEGVVVGRLTREGARLTATLCSGATLSQSIPDQDDLVAVALLAEHLAHGRFAAFETIGRDQQ